MSDLRKQLKQAGLLKGKQAKKIEREERHRQHLKAKAERAGDEGALAELETEEERRAKELAAERERERQRQAEAAKVEREAREEAARFRQMHDLIESNRMRPGPPDEPWFFVAANGRVERMMVSYSVAEGLRRSTLAVVEPHPDLEIEGGFQFVLMQTAAALRLDKLDPYAIRFLNLGEYREGPLIDWNIATIAGAGAREQSEEDEFLVGL